MEYVNRRDSRNEKLTELTGYISESQRGLAWWLSRVHPEDRNRRKFKRRRYY